MRDLQWRRRQFAVVQKARDGRKGAQTPQNEKGSLGALLVILPFLRSLSLFAALKNYGGSFDFDLVYGAERVSWIHNKSDSKFPVGGGPQAMPEAVRISRKHKSQPDTTRVVRHGGELTDWANDPFVTHF